MNFKMKIDNFHEKVHDSQVYNYLPSNSNYYVCLLADRHLFGDYGFQTIFNLNLHDENPD